MRTIHRIFDSQLKHRMRLIQEQLDQRNDLPRSCIDRFKTEIGKKNPHLSPADLEERWLEALRADLQVKKDLQREIETLALDSRLNIFEDLLPKLHVAACLKNPSLREKETNSFDELFADIFNTLDIDCYFYAESGLPTTPFLEGMILGQEYMLQKIIDIASTIEESADSTPPLAQYRETQEHFAYIQTILDQTFLPYERISFFYRSPGLEELLLSRQLETLPLSSYTYAIQAGMTQFGPTSTEQQSSTAPKADMK